MCDYQYLFDGIAVLHICTWFRCLRLLIMLHVVQCPIIVHFPCTIYQLQEKVFGFALQHALNYHHIIIIIISDKFNQYWTSEKSNLRKFLHPNSKGFRCKVNSLIIRRIRALVGCCVVHTIGQIFQCLLFNGAFALRSGTIGCNIIPILIKWNLRNTNPAIRLQVWVSNKAFLEAINYRLQ